MAKLLAVSAEAASTNEAEHLHMCKAWITGLTSAKLFLRAHRNWCKGKCKVNATSELASPARELLQFLRQQKLQFSWTLELLAHKAALLKNMEDGMASAQALLELQRCGGLACLAQASREGGAEAARTWLRSALESALLAQIGSWSADDMQKETWEKEMQATLEALKKMGDQVSDVVVEIVGIFQAMLTLLEAARGGGKARRLGTP